MGELAALLASLCWAVASLLFTRLRASVGALELNLAKCWIGGGLMVAALATSTGRPWPLDIGRTDLPWLAASGLVGLAVGDSCYFQALSRVGPRRALLLTTLTPPITAVMAVPLLNEPLTLRMTVGMAVTLGGVAWVVAERAPAAAPAHRPAPATGGRRRIEGTLFALAAAASQAGANVLTKLGDSGYSALEISLVRLAFGAAGLGVAVGLGRGGPRSMLRPLLGSRRTAGLLVLATFIGTFLGVWLQVAGLTHASVGIAATLSSTAPIFILPLAALGPKEQLSARSTAGALVAVLGIALLFAC